MDYGWSIEPRHFSDNLLDVHRLHLSLVVGGPVRVNPCLLERRGSRRWMSVVPILCVAHLPVISSSVEIPVLENAGS
jgi:hypothetical protein